MKLTATILLASATFFISTEFLWGQTAPVSRRNLGELEIENGRLVQHEAQWIRLSQDSEPSSSKSSTLTGNFDVNMPNGLPRNGVAEYVIEYEVIFTADPDSENIDYFAFNAPVGWTIDSIGPAPSQTDCFGNPHDNVISGFSATSAYWGGDYGGGVVTPGDTTTYPEIGNRSGDTGGCGAFSTNIDPAAADTHTFYVEMTPSASGTCPGSTTGALPLCCTGTEISAGADPPSGSEAYFNELRGATDTNADPFGDVWYYVSLGCPFPFVLLDKIPLPSPATIGECESADGDPVGPDTLVIQDPPGDPAQFCYQLTNFSQVVFSDPWGATECDSLDIDDDSLGAVLDADVTNFVPFANTAVVEDSLVQAPEMGECWENVARSVCVTPPGSDYVPDVGIQTGQRNRSTPSALGNLGVAEAAICTEEGAALPVEMASFQGSVNEKGVLLEWVTASETNNAGFAVERRFAEKPAFEEVGFIEGAGTTDAEQRYSFLFEDPEPGRQVFRLKQVDFDGSFELSEEIEVDVSVPGTHYLTEGFPNPFSSATRFALSVSVEQKVNIGLFDAAGRRLSTIYDRTIPADKRVSFEIDGSNLPSGVYYVQATGERFTQTQAVTVVR